MSLARARLGRRAEAHARAHLEAAGLTFVTRNWKAPPHPHQGGHGGELDLVMRDGPVLVIVEVRASAGPHPFAGGAAYTIGPLKQRRLVQLAQLFMQQHRELPKTLRFDVVTLTKRGLWAWDVRWYRNALSA